MENTWSKFIHTIWTASRLEVLTPKPGNVSKTQNVKGISAQDFLNVIEILEQTSLQFPKKILHFFEDYCAQLHPFMSVNLQSSSLVGKIIFSLCVEMMAIEPHSNLLLGHILLFSPIIAAVLNREVDENKSKLDFEKEPNNKNQTFSNYFQDNLWDDIALIFSESTIGDGILLFLAISLCNPGGLENPGQKSIKFDNTFIGDAHEIVGKLINDQANLPILFAQSEEFDSISQNLMENYRCLRNFAAKWRISNSLIELASKKITIETEIQDHYTSEILDLFLNILSKTHDSLIFRKFGVESAEMVRKKASKILECENSKQKQEKLIEFNQYLLKSEINPGTTADLVACVILIKFCRLIH